MASLAAVLLLVAAWFAVISPTLQSAAALDVETASQQAASQQLESTDLAAEEAE